MALSSAFLQAQGRAPVGRPILPPAAQQPTMPQPALPPVEGLFPPIAKPGFKFPIGGIGKIIGNFGPIDKGFYPALPIDMMYRPPVNLQPGTAPINAQPQQPQQQEQLGFDPMGMPTINVNPQPTSQQPGMPTQMFQPGAPQAQLLGPQTNTGEVGITNQAPQVNALGLEQGPVNFGAEAQRSSDFGVEQKLGQNIQNQRMLNQRADAQQAAGNQITQTGAPVQAGVTQTQQLPQAAPTPPPAAPNPINPTGWQPGQDITTQQELNAAIQSIPRNLPAAEQQRLRSQYVQQSKAYQAQKQQQARAEAAQRAQQQMAQRQQQMRDAQKTAQTSALTGMIGGQLGKRLGTNFASNFGVSEGVGGILGSALGGAAGKALGGGKVRGKDILTNVGMGLASNALSNLFRPQQNTNWGGGYNKPKSGGFLGGLGSLFGF